MKIWPLSTRYSISVPDPAGQCASLSPDHKAQSAEPQVWPKPRFKSGRRTNIVVGTISCMHMCTDVEGVLQMFQFVDAKSLLECSVHHGTRNCSHWLTTEQQPLDLLARSLSWSVGQSSELISFICPPVTESFSSSSPANSLLLLGWEQLAHIRLTGADALSCWTNIILGETEGRF